MKDGGSAFPHIFEGIERDLDGKPLYSRTGISGGMTLQDYFAGQALAGFLSANDITTKKECGNKETYHNRISSASYNIADAMLAEREKRNGKDSD